VVALLQSEGYEVWWDHQLRGGEHYPTIIKEKLQSCAYAIVLWSQHSVASEWVNLEAREAKKASKLVPVQISACELPAEFKELHTLTFQQWPQLLGGLYSAIPHGRHEWELRSMTSCHQQLIPGKVPLR